MKHFLQTKKFLGMSLFLIIAVVLFSYTDLLQFKNAKQIINYDDLQPVVKTKRLKNDRPDLFAKYMNDIRKGFGEDNPGYPANYRIKELLKATNLNSTYGLSKLAKTNIVNWTERGPGNVSGRTRSIVVDPDDATFNTWFVGNVSGGVWKTTDAGASWTHLTASLPTLATSVLVMSESNHNIMYLGTGEGFGNIDQVHGSGIWKTTDRGINWTQLSSTTNLNFQNITRIIIDPTNPDIVLASTSAGWKGANVTSGIWMSTDGGNTWTQKYSTTSTVEDLVANPSNFNTQYATVNAAGVIKSLNGGNSWVSSSSGIVGTARMEITVAPTDTSKIYASSELGIGGNATLYVSDDAGATWNPSTDLGGNKDWFGGPDNGQGWYDNAIAVDPYDATTVYVGGINIMKLTVGTGTSTSAPQILGVDEVNTSSFWAFVNWGSGFGNGGLDKGENFHGLTANTTSSDFSTVEIRFGPGLTQKAHRFLWASGFQYTYQNYADVPFEVWDTDNNRQLMASFRDQDDDGTWNLKTRANGTEGFSRDYIFINAIPYNASTPDANITVTAGMAYKNIYAMWPESPAGTVFDGANLPDSKIVINWGTITQKNITTTVISDAYGEFGPGPNSISFVHPDHHNLTIIKTNPATQSFRFINGNDGGVTYSDNKGISFIKTLNGYNTTQFYGVDKMPNKNKYIGGTQDNGSWLSPLNPTASSAWSSTPGGDGFEAVWNYGDLNQLLESSQFNDIYKSSNGGAGWTSVTGIPKSVALAPFITRIAKSKLAPDRVLIVSKNAIYRSENFGDTWTAISMSGQPGWDGSRSSTQIKFSLADPSIIWSGRALTIGFPFFVSTDSGVTFSQTQIPSITPNASISGLATHPTDANTAYVLFSNAQKAKIIMTTDLGQTWSELSGFGSNTSSSNDFPDVAVYSLLVMPTNTNIIWAGTEIGIFESTDAGATWHYSNNGFPAVAVWEMLAFDGQVIVATHGRGIWTAPLSDIVVGVETITSVIPNDYSLSQNYPNPFNPSTTINFSLPVKSNVSLIIYDVLGRKVNEVVNEELPAGIQKVIWNGLNSSGVRTSSGVYFYRLIAKAENGNQFVQSKKMILMK